MPIPSSLHRCGVELAASASRHLSYIICTLLAMAAIWCHRFPAGIDLPQHANLFRVLADLTTGPLEYRELYRVDWFTPYLLAYVLAYPLTLAWGAIVAVKCLLTLSAVGTPLLMRRWLKTVGARQELGLFGFLLAFDFSYQWGFLSQSLAMPLMFGYLAAVERQGARPGWWAILSASLWGVALFFCHGITFAVCMVTMVGCLVIEGGWLKAWRRVLHALPLAALALLWLAVHGRQADASTTDAWFANGDRLVTLFSGPFMAHPSLPWAAASVAALVVLLLVTRPHLAWQTRRMAPLVIALDCFLVLPEYMAATALVASRFCVFVHAFAPAALEFRSTDWLRRQSSRVVFGMVAAGLLLLNFRLLKFNEELVGLRDLSAHMQPGMDVHNLMPQTHPDSEVFGSMQFGQVPAWITAAQGGIIDDDSAKYYQMPIKRNDVPFPNRQRYLIARGGLEVTWTVVTTARDARLIYSSGSWLLFEDRLSLGREATVVRSAQSWGKLRLDRSVSGSPLAIAGSGYQHGLGTVAGSFIRLRIERDGYSFTGACGIDDRSKAYGKAEFRIRDDSGEVLFESGEVLGGEPARRFVVILAGRKELLLEAHAVDSNHHAHADWVDLRVQGPP